MSRLIAGSGYVGERLAAHWRSQGHTVWTLRRRPDPRDAFALQADLTSTEPLLLPPDITHAVFCAGLQRAEPSAYRALFVDGLKRLIEALTDRPVQRFCFVSTTGVYGEVNGEWVDENTHPSPRREPARYYLAGERLAAQAPFPSLVTRLSGIYGPDRDRLLRSVRDGTARLDPAPARFLNHIHVDDIVGAMDHLMDHLNPEPLYLLTDSEPTDRNTIISWLAKRHNRPAPEQSDPDQSTPPARGGNKRCRNHRLLESGYVFRYPTFREGYAALDRG